MTYATGYFSPPAAPAYVTTPEKMRDIIKRLVAVMQEEDQLLNERKSIALDSLIQKKSQLLLELMRSEKTIAKQDVVTHLSGDIVNLKNAIAENQRLLSVHLAAAREITETILSAIQSSESDGTYAHPYSAGFYA